VARLNAAKLMLQEATGEFDRARVYRDEINDAELGERARNEGIGILKTICREYEQNKADQRFALKLVQDVEYRLVYYEAMFGAGESEKLLAGVDLQNERERMRLNFAELRGYRHTGQWRELQAKARQFIYNEQNPESYRADVAHDWLRSYYFDKDYLGLADEARDYVAHCRPGTYQWARGMIYLGLAKYQTSQSDPEAAATVFQQILDANIADDDPNDNARTNAAFWLAHIARIQGDQEGEAEMVDRIENEMPDGPERARALAAPRSIENAGER
jgi:hypothetical protein